MIGQHRFRCTPSALFCLLVFAAIALSSPARAKPLVGFPSVIDGDTIEIHGQRICLDAATKKYRRGCFRRDW
ncbi:hypothetical protein [Mesorhizobium shangrilense]|uniref:Thermonuclease family protein n=1 Tax=Mesorhizobium shangrilense TaxID=460060 RepID=A0ABV2DFT3_9HYPH